MTQTLGSKVKELRESSKFKISQEELANYIGISRVSLANAELGKRELKEDELSKIAEFFDITLSELLPQKTAQNDDARKNLKALILYISENYQDKEHFGKTMLNKLLYFSDFNYYEWTGSLISGAEYKKLPYGPVPTDITNVLEEMVREGMIALKEEKVGDYTQVKIVPLEHADTSFFDEIDAKNKQTEAGYTPYEDLPPAKHIVDTVLDKYRNWKAVNLSDLSHEDTPYKATKKFGDVIQPELVFYRSPAFIVNHHNL